MKIDITNTDFTLVSDKSCILQFNGTTAICLDSISEESYLTFDSGDIYEIEADQNVYAKSLERDGERYVTVEHKKAMNVSGVINQEILDITPATMMDYYSFSVADGDFITTSRSSNGQQFTEVSIDPLSVGDTQTIIEYKRPFRFPAYAEIEASLSQRTKGDYVVMEITDKDTSMVDTPTEFSIVSLSQTTTTLTVTLNAAFDGWLGSWIDIYGLDDNRFNYTNLAVATISADRKVLTCTTSDEATLPTLTATPASFTNGKVKRQAKLMSAANAIAMRFTGTSATTTAYMARFGGGSIKEAGTLTGSRLWTSATTVPTYTSGKTGQVEIKASSRFRIDVEPDFVAFTDKTIDTFAIYASRAVFSAVKPDTNLDYYVRFRAVSPKSISKPIAKIVSIVKTGTTTATVTTDIPHGLTTASYVTIKGVRDITNFPNLTTPTIVASTPTSTTFTIVIGSAVTATSYGGAVIICNGQVDQQGIIAQNIQSVARDETGLVTLVGNTTWAGFGGVGEYVNIYGVRSAIDGSDLGVDGVYKVHNAATTTLILEPVKNLDGTYTISGNGSNVTPAGYVIDTTNCGGCVILRTTLRSHDLILATYSQTVTRIAGQGTQRLDLAIPVYPVVGSIVTANEGTPSTPSVGTLTTAASTNGTSIKATAGNVYSITASNTTASAIYLKIYNKASAPTVGTDVPLMTIPVAANSFESFEFGRLGARFATGIAIAVTAGIASNDTAPVLAGSLITIQYQ